MKQSNQNKMQGTHACAAILSLTLLVFCLQIRPLIPSHSIPFLSNPIIFNTIIHLSPNPKGRKMRQKTTQICPLDVKKNHK